MNDCDMEIETESSSFLEIELSIENNNLEIITDYIFTVQINNPIPVKGIVKITIPNAI